MGLMRRLAALVMILGVLSIAGPTAPAVAHRDGCHAAHSCPSDANPPTYTCGDTGNYTYCPGLSGSAFATGGTSATVGSLISAYVSWSVAVTPGSATYQWYRSGVAIPGAVATSYTVTLDDIGQSLSMTASAVDGRGQTATASSAAITPGYPPLPTGLASLSTSTATVDTSLAAAVSWSRPATATYQWLRGAVAIAGATATGYTVTKDDLGQPLKLVATVTEYGRTTTVSTSTVTPIADATITLTAPRAVRTGKTAVLRGALVTEAGPAGRIVTVKAWQRVGRRWVLRDNWTGPVSTTGSFTMKQQIPTNRRGTWRFKASYAGTTGVRAAQSSYVSLRAR